VRPAAIHARRAGARPALAGIMSNLGYLLAAAAIEAALDETAYAEASAEGATLDLDAAVDAARALAAVR
jgi:hypothetical protein